MQRCGWATGTPDYLAYHDQEWGTVLHGDDAMYERLTLEAFQSGLSWLTILRKRENFRAAFARFALPVVAGFGAADVTRLMADAGIVRNRAKIDAAIGNARAALALPDGLDALLWSFAPDPPPPRPATLSNVPTTSPGSVAMARELKRRGFRFVGPTTAYALMQATGMVDDHVGSCWRAASPPRPRPEVPVVPPLPPVRDNGTRTTGIAVPSRAGDDSGRAHVATHLGGTHGGHEAADG